MANITEILDRAVGRLEGSDEVPGNPVSIWTGTEAEYEAITTYDANTLYFITE